MVAAERRIEYYRFGSLKELVLHYQEHLSVPEIEKAILEAGINFISRIFVTPFNDHLQFIRSCESLMEMNRMIAANPQANTQSLGKER